MTNRSRTLRNSLFCSVVFLACWLIAHPFANLAFVDDWAFTKTALTLAQTGHLRYYGWGAPMLGWQAAWGALFIRLFGFSFNIVRISMLPIALAAIFLFHLILARFDIPDRNAVIGTLALALSPLFLPLSASFMTDIPGVFSILLCIYLCLRAVQSCSARAAIAWLAAAVLSNLIAGTARQIIWLGVLVIVPSAAWLLRKRRGVLPAVAFMWLISTACIYACTRWFARQPYAVANPSIAHTGNSVIRTILNLTDLLLCTFLVLFPIFAAWIPQVRRLPKLTFVRTGLILVVYGLLAWRANWVMPWLPDTLAAEFANPSPLKPGTLPRLLLPSAASITASLIVIAVGLLFAEAATTPPIRHDAETSTSWRVTGWLLGPFALVYVTILICYGYKVLIVDRYLLILMPLAIIVLLKLYQQRIGPSLPNLSIALVALFAILAVAGTHDWFAAYRARVRAIEQLRTAGIPRTSIQGGFEYDGWTQLQNEGHATRHLSNSLRAADPGIAALRITSPCTSEFEYAPLAPSVKARYFITPNKLSCLAPSGSPPVSYHVWLPPFRRWIYVQQLPNNSPLDAPPAKS